MITKNLVKFLAKKLVIDLTNFLANDHQKFG